MKRVCKRLLSLLLVVSVMLSVTPSVYAVDDELYISELRLVYAEDYDTAREILDDGAFKDYELLDENLNADTGEIGVWLAYKTTADIEDAITDLAVMQMNGGYKEGNYQEMIKESMEEYTKLGETYLEAIDYFIEAYDAGDYMAEAAYRQLNFYTSITSKDLGIKIPGYDGELLGDVLYDGVDAKDLATIFLQGNRYALQNVRSLLAMGVSYNEDGTHYLEKVAAEVENADSYEDGDYDELALLIAGSILTFQNMFKDLAAYEDELDYSDDEDTDLELNYAEHKSLADRMREVAYLDGETLYDFILNYKLDKSNLMNLYPLAAALNEGQQAMTKVAHYYDVVRYSMSDYPEDVLDELITEQEEFYADAPFDIYAGVDRTVYYGTFALTSAAYRADAYTEEGFLNSMFKEQATLSITSLAAFAGGTALSVWAIRRTLDAKNAALSESAKLEATKQATRNTALYMKENIYGSTSSTVSSTSSSGLGQLGASYGKTYSEVADALLAKYKFGSGALEQPLHGKFYRLLHQTEGKMNPDDLAIVEKMKADYDRVYWDNHNSITNQLEEAQNMTTHVSPTVSGITIAMYIAGGLLLLYSTVGMILTLVNYYNPDYDDIPVALVDLIETTDGDRYIKYDVVYEAEEREKGVYAAADLNAFEAQRWNALYYTKSYEAGQPLLADEFEVSYNNHFVDDGYTPVHRFGEDVCYDLNKYNFDNDTPSIYLSVMQSENQKAAVADVPDVIGSVFSTGLLFLAGGIGAIAGIGGTLATLSFSKKKKKEDKDEES